MPIRYSSKDLIKMIEADGWGLISTKGSHHQFSHESKKDYNLLAHLKCSVFEAGVNEKSGVY